MFLNKQDLLKVKVLEGCFKIETYFPEYSSYQIANDGESTACIQILNLEK